MRVLLADDEEKVRSALKLVLEQEEGMNITGELEDLKHIVEMLEKTKPDLLIFDWELVPERASDFVESIREIIPELSMIAISSGVLARQEAQDAGVQFFLSKVDPPDRLITILRDMKGCRQEEGLDLQWNLKMREVIV